MKQYKPVFVFAGGGTGGHLFPAIAVAEAVQTKIPNADIHFIGRADKLEAVHVPKYGFTFHAIPAEGFSRKNMLVNIRVLIKFVAGFLQCLRMFMKMHPVAAITTGAYISAPVIAAARVMGAKVFMVEPNSYPGLVTRLFDKSVEEIYIAFEETKQYLRKPEKTYISGNPIRKSFQAADKAACKTALGFNPEQPVVFVTGGSLGAAKINSATAELIPVLESAGIQTYWQTGKNYFAQYGNMESAATKVTAFVDDMPTALQAADVLIARAGATTIAEILGTGVCAIVIPSPNVAENHQYYNAKSLADAGAAVLIEEKDIASRLEAEVVRLCGDSSAAALIGNNAKHMHKLHVAETIAERIVISTSVHGN